MCNRYAHGGNKVQNGYFKYKGHKVISFIAVIVKGFIRRVCISNMQSLSLAIISCGQFICFGQTNKQINRQVDAPEFYSVGHKIQTNHQKKKR